MTLEEIIIGIDVDASSGILKLKQFRKELMQTIKGASFEPFKKSITSVSRDLSEWNSSLKKGLPLVQKWNAELTKTRNQAAAADAKLKKLSAKTQLNMKPGFTDVDDVLISTKNGIRNLDTEFKAMGNRQKKLRKEAKDFKMEYLGIMFAGMAMQRFFGGFISGAFRTFNTITEGTKLANNSVNQLRAAWEFFKFSLISALMASPMFQQLVQQVIRLVNWFGNLSPKTQAWIAGILIVLAALGAVLFVVGQIVLGASSIMMAFGITGKEILAFLKGLFAVKKVFLFLKLLSSEFMKLLTKGLAFLVANPIALLILALLAVVGVFFLLKKKFGTWQNALKAWAAALVLAIAFIFQGLVFIVKEGLDLVLGGIQAIIRGAAKAASALGFGGTASKLNSAANALQGFGDMKIDVVGKTAELLDKHGFNPEPVRQTPEAAQPVGNTYNINQLSIDSLSGDNGLEEELQRSGQFYGFGQ